jgi:hypothetical protein
MKDTEAVWASAITRLKYIFPFAASPLLQISWTSLASTLRGRRRTYLTT